MDLKEQSALLRILALMASADGSVGSQEQQMVQRHFDGHFLGSFPDAWEGADQLHGSQNSFFGHTREHATAHHQAVIHGYFSLWR